MDGHKPKDGQHVSTISTGKLDEEQNVTDGIRPAGQPVPAPCTGESPVESSPTDTSEGKTAMSFTDFTQETSLHGLKYIFQTGKTFRRILWLLIVLAALCLFVSQLYIRTHDFYDYETNVDVQVVYTNDVTFPAVTVCNQNSFRLTELADLGLYGFIVDVYTTRNVTDIDFAMYDPDRQDPESFLRETAHQKNDLIESCVWKGKPCDVDKDFITVLTGLGLCYTFNFGENSSAHTVVKSGSKAGLSLVLNLEQYEFTPGPQSDAGVKVLLHGQSEYPMADKLGFAVSPGTHTLVGVHETKVGNLPDPYSDCTEGGAPMSDCLSDCRTRQTIERCGCRAPYMRPLDDSPAEMCSMEELFRCVQRKDAGNITTTECDCNLPCKRTTYEASLSYAQLSHFNIDRKVLKDKTRQEAVWDRQYKAREMFQLVDEVAVEENENEYNELVAHTANLQQLLAEMRTTVSQDGILGLLSRISDGLWQDQYTLETEYNRVRELVLDYETRTRDLQLGSLITDTVQNYLWKANGLLVDDLHACLELNGTQECNDLFQTTLLVFKDQAKLARDTFAGFESIYQTYISVIDDVYTGSPLSASNHSEHLQCLSHFNDVLTSFVLPDLAIALDVITGIGSDNEHITEAYIEAVQMLTDFSNRTELAEYKAVMRAVVLDYRGCGWLGTHRYNVYQPDFTDAKPHFAVSGWLWQMSTTVDTFILPAVSTVEKLLNETIAPIVKTTKLYMEGQIQKLNMSEELRTDVYMNAPNDIELAEKALQKHARTLLMEVETTERQVLDGFRLLFKLDFPITDSDRLGQLAFLDLARNVNATTYSSVPDSAAMDEVVKAVFSLMIDPIYDLKARLRETTDGLATVLVQQQEQLRQFSDQINMDDTFYMSNFLKLDIYYEELKYDQVQQFPAFEDLSLMGEVGGILGLLLGASTLTVFELFDFIAVAVIGRLRYRGGQRKSSESL